MSEFGPSLPPHLLSKRKRKQEDAAESSPTNTPGANKSPSPESAEKKRRIAGPAPPPGPLDERPTESVNAEDESNSDDDDDFGPALPSVNDSSTHPPSNAEDDHQPPPAAVPLPKPKHDDWMTMPPDQDDLASRMDPTKTRARGFNTGKGAKGPPSKSDSNNSAWHETPFQKRQRLENELLGITTSDIGPAKPPKRSKSAKDEEAARRVQEYGKARGPSLMEQHKGNKPEAVDDDPSKRAFDREKDMGSGMIGRGQRKELLAKAAGFSEKFSGGSYL